MNNQPATMSRREMRRVLRWTKRSNTNPTPETHVLVRKDSLQLIILEAYRMGKEDKDAKHTG